ncbi:methyltransferase domain-containing protein [Methanonatronarchaeum sp. AMET-Sl]|uniref:methyltransferase domain-containing protein n=1 Tax=Methanonatronarchaeum sp. AMET-Sl TaxID=3037654 RepID=UPI00244DE67C|nr:methyltransferase domain-containing protein [Methanonatronarchaeum sp. AMET-Sl]WGI17453.1 methyltransferase domain-containing protein [Methanonatronarchaeum sp. AMET-Sl]
MKEKIKEFYSKVAEGEVDGFTEIDVNESPEAETASEDLISLGCDYPLHDIKMEGKETVLELGSGGGLNCFITSQLLPKGEVVGLDFSGEMAYKAQKDINDLDIDNIEFVVGDAEKIPFKENTFDVVFTNCVLNLIKKEMALDCINKILKPGGRAYFSEIIVNKDIPEELREDISMVVTCLAGANTEKQLEEKLNQNGLKITDRQNKERILSMDPEGLVFHKVRIEAKHIN